MCQLALNAFTCLNTLLNKYIEKKKDHRDILEQYSRSRIIWVESWILNKSHKRCNALAQVFVFFSPHFRGRCVLNVFFPSETWWTYWLNETTINQEPRLPWYWVQFSSVTQSCPTLCDPMNCSMPGLPVYHQLPGFTQIHVHRVSDAIQSSHPLLSPFPPAPNPSQLQSLFQWVNSSHEVAKVLEFQL